MFYIIWIFLDSEFGKVSDNFIMDSVNCGGSENTLWDCHHDKYDNCGPTEGAGVACSDPFRKGRFRSITTV